MVGSYLDENYFNPDSFYPNKNLNYLDELHFNSEESKYKQNNYALRFFSVEINLINLDDAGSYALRLLSSQFLICGNDSFDLSKKLYYFVCRHNSNSEGESIQTIANKIFRIKNQNLLIGKYISNFTVQRY